MMLRFSLIMSLLFSIAAIIGKFHLVFVVVTFIISLCIFFAFSCSFRIVISENNIKVFQCFIRIAKININEIVSVVFQKFADNGQGCALVITTRDGNERIFPVRLYGSENVKIIVNEISRHIKNQNIVKQQKLHKLKTLNFVKFFINIMIIILILKVVECFFYKYY